jgi:hypothetical protein
VCNFRPDELERERLPRKTDFVLWVPVFVLALWFLGTAVLAFWPIEGTP